MKKLLILSIFLFFFNWGKAQTVSDSLKYVYAQISILKTMAYTNKSEFLAYKTATDKRIKVLEDSVSKITVLVFDSNDFDYRKGALGRDSVALKKQ